MSEFLENNEMNEEVESTEVEETKVENEEVEVETETESEETVEVQAEETATETTEVETSEEKEAEETTDSDSMTTMADALDSVLEIKKGDTVTADVLAFDEDNQVRVAIKNSGGLEGVIPLKELAATRVEDPSEVVSIGDEIELVVLKPIKDKENGNFLLSKTQLEAKKVWADIKEIADRGETIEAPVKEIVKGGLVVDAGVRGFVPASMVEDYFVDDFSPYKGQTLEFKIVEIDADENRLILSHKEIAREKREAERMGQLEEDSIIEGKVARLTNFGAFIDLGGVDGLVHISRIAHEHVKHPSDKLTVGDVINVKVLSVDEEEGRISLSIKDTLAGPWDDIEEKAPEGSVHKGIVKRLTNFGAFVEVFPGVEGLVHISQIAHEHIATPEDRLTEGQEVDVKVLSADPEAQRLSLSIKALLDKPEGFEEKQEEVSRPTNDPHTRKPKQNNRNNQSRSQTKNHNQSSKNTSTSINDSASEGSFTLGDMLGSDAFKNLQEDSEN